MTDLERIAAALERIAAALETERTPRPATTRALRDRVTHDAQRLARQFGAERKAG